MENVTTYKCPNCEAGLIFDAEKQAFVCEFCISEFSEDELISRAKSEQDYSSEIDEYICPSCGAEVIADKNTAALFCYYCHNPVVLSGKVSGSFKPTKIIPFKLSKEQACQEFLRYAKKKIFAPRDYFSAEQMDRITGVYYPFWVNDSDTDSYISAIGKKVRTWRSGDYRYTETSTYDVYRRGRIHFEDVSSSAISTEDKDMLEGVLPYPIEEYRDFNMPYLQGFLAKKRDMDKEALYDSVKKRIDGYSNTILSGTAGGYTSFMLKGSDSTILSSHWEYSLLPVWILTYVKKGKNSKKDKTYVYAMNGSTGKVYGEFPVSLLKLILMTLGVFIGSLLIFLLMGYFFFG